MTSNVGRRTLSARRGRSGGPLVLFSAVALSVTACTASGGTGTPATVAPSASMMLASAAATASATPTVTAATSASAVAAGGPAAALEQEYESVIGRVLPSVVQITTSTGLGSGIVYDSAGDIVTNDHVVGTAKTFQVQFSSSVRPVSATLVGAFPAGDLAVIKVSATSGLRPAVFADSSQTRVGEIVLAMGNPLGLSSSVTDGIVSAVGRTLTEPQSADSPGATLPDSVQTSAAINPGNSGGALVNLQGQVIGIPTLAATDQQEGGAAPGIGFAIPSNTVSDIAGQLIAHGKVTNSHRAALGVTATSLTNQAGNPVGVGIVSVTAGGAAARAGLRAGDIVTRVAGTPTPDTQTLSTVLAGLTVGQRTTVTFERGTATQTVQVTLSELGSS